MKDILSYDDISSYKAIGTIYTEKFIGTDLPTSPFGAWLINGNGIVNNGVTLIRADDWSAYLQLTQRTHFDSDGVKWRIQLNDVTSRIRIERRTSTAPVGFSSTVELDNGILRIFQSELSADGIPTSILAERATTLSLVANREYKLTLETFGEVLTFAISDTVTGEIDKISYTSTGQGAKNAGRCWDYPRFYVAGGDVKILQFDYFSKLPRSPKAVLVGDSIIEADTIRNEIGGGYKNRWAGMLYNALKGNVAILGTAGETSAGMVEKLPILEKAFKAPEYVLLAHMTNDLVFEDWKTNTEKIIKVFVVKGATPVICMMPQRENREAFYEAVLDYVTKSRYEVIWFNRTLTVNGDGMTRDMSLFCDDLHPNVQGHARMFEQVKADLEEIFQPGF